MRKEVKERYRPSERSRRQEVVGVQAHDELPACRRETVVEGFDLACITVVANNSYARVAAGEAFGDIGAAVRRGVVDNNNFWLHSFL